MICLCFSSCCPFRQPRQRGSCSACQFCFLRNHLMPVSRTIEYVCASLRSLILSLHQSVPHPFSVYTCLSVCPSVRLFVCLSVCLPIHLTRHCIGILMLKVADCLCNILERIQGGSRYDLQFWSCRMTSYSSKYLYFAGSLKSVGSSV